MAIKNTFSLLGLGKHADKAIIPAFKSSNTAELALIGSSKEYLKNVISYQEAVESNLTDSVYIALPNSMHAHWCIEALKSNKNVICEKPLCLNLEQAQRVIEIQKSSNTKLLEAFMYRFHPQHQIVKDLLEKKSLGTPRLFEAHFHYHLEDINNIRLKKELGGGSIYDVGCYLIDCCLFLFEDKISTIYGNSVFNQETGIDEVSTAYLKFDSGMVANLTCGTKLNRQSSYCIYCEQGKITVRDAFKIPANKKGLVVIERYTGEKEEIYSASANHYQLMIDAFCETNIYDNQNILNRAKMLQDWKSATITN